VQFTVATCSYHRRDRRSDFSVTRSGLHDELARITGDKRPTIYEWRRATMSAALIEHRSTYTAHRAWNADGRREN